METTLFVTKEYLEKQFKSFNNTLVKPNDKKIKEWLTTLNGNVEVEGSIANTIAKKIASVISGAPEEYDTLKEIADWISNHASNAEEMLAKIEANKEGILSENEKIELVEGIISTLNGSIDEEGSIAKMLKDAINTSVDNIIICESEDEDIDFNSASWLKGEILYTADMVTDRNITSFVVPEGTTEICENAFWGCKNLESITLPSTLKKIGNSAFRNCTSLTSIVIPEGVTEIGGNAFQNCPNLESVALPSTLTKIESSAFRGCTSLTSIDIPEGVTEIGDYAFNTCSKLSSVTLPSTLNKIGNGVFSSCPLTSIDIPESVTEIGGSAFSGCPLTSIVIPEGVTEIGGNVFQNCPNLESVALPSTLTKIGASAFFGCPLTSIVIHEGVTEIGDNVFANCTKLESLTLPSTLTEIGSSAFSDWSKVTFAEGSPFKKENSIVYNLETGVLLSSYDRKNITSIVIPEGITDISNNAFFGCNKLTSVTLPSTLKKIGASAFQTCTSLTYIVIPEGVTEIGNNAFFYCSKLASVTLPSTLTEIGNQVFGNCSSLSTVNFTGSEEQWNAITKGANWNINAPSNMQIVYNYHA